VSRKFGRREIAQRTMWPGIVVIVLPRVQHNSDLGEGGEQRLVQQLVSLHARSRFRVVLGHVAGPALGGVEGDDPDHVLILAIERRSDCASLVSRQA
jgi:hypothetical protein